MLRTALFTLIALISFVGCAQSVHAEPPAAQHNYLLDSSLRILMLSERDGELNANPSLGSLIMHDGQPTILTHNHWTSLNNDTAVEMQVFDLTGTLLARLPAQLITAMTIHSDAGTLMLAAPAEVSRHVRAAQIGRVNDIQPNMQLQMVYGHATVAGGETFVITMVTVEQLSQHHGLPIFQLRGLDGQIAQRGNSGGAVFLNGQLVGNMWGTIAENGTMTNNSFAAAIPTITSDIANSVHNIPSGEQP